MTINDYVAALGMCRFSFLCFSYQRAFVIRAIELAK